MNCNYQQPMLMGIALVFGIIAPVAASADTVLGSDVSQMYMWQGRAGGLVHSDRVSNLRVRGAGENVSIAYDKDVAQRTNMQRGELEARNIAVTFDKEVARRTNMRRDDHDTQTAQATRQQ